MENHNPDLTSVLRTLSALAPAPTPASASPPAPAPTPTPSHAPPNQDQHPQPTPSQSSREREFKDPRRITTWPQALQHTTRLLAQNHTLQDQIRALIRRQHQHERSWWKGREALLEKQRDRAEKRRALDEVLRSVGASPSSSKIELESHEEELHAYDLKVHRAATEMQQSMERELQRLGIPFFGTSPDLIVRSGSDNSSSANNNGTITEEELLALRRRIIEFLSDYCSE